MEQDTKLGETHAASATASQLSDIAWRRRCQTGWLAVADAAWVERHSTAYCSFQ